MPYCLFPCHDADSIAHDHLSNTHKYGRVCVAPCCICAMQRHSFVSCNVFLLLSLGAFCRLCKNDVIFLCQLLQARVTQAVQWWTASVLKYLHTVKAFQATHKVEYQRVTDVAFRLLETVCSASIFQQNSCLMVSNVLYLFVCLSLL